MLAHKQFYSHAARVLSAEDSQVGREADLFSISTAISDRDYCKAAKWYQSNIVPLGRDICRHVLPELTATTVDAEVFSDACDDLSQIICRHLGLQTICLIAPQLRRQEEAATVDIPNTKNQDLVARSLFLPAQDGNGQQSYSVLLVAESDLHLRQKIETAFSEYSLDLYNLFEACSPPALLSGRLDDRICSALEEITLTRTIYFPCFSIMTCLPTPKASDTATQQS